MGKKPDYNYWLTMPYWTPMEAICLLTDIEPPENTGDARPWMIKHAERLRRLVHVGELKQYCYDEQRDSYGIAPLEAITWAIRKGRKIPPRLETFARVSPELVREKLFKTAGKQSELLYERVSEIEKEMGDTPSSRFLGRKKKLVLKVFDDAGKGEFSFIQRDWLDSDDLYTNNQSKRTFIGKLLAKRANSDQIPHENYQKLFYAYQKYRSEKFRLK